MRILVLSNFYPPYTFGGQEQSCKKVVEGLKLRGHQIVVLTSTYGVDHVSEGGDYVYRALYMETDLVAWRQALNFFTQTQKKEKHNLKFLASLIDEFRPDMIFIWGMWNISRSVPALAESMCPGRVVYRFADYWPTLPSQKELYWHNRGRTWFSRIPKRMLGSLALAIIRHTSRVPDLKFQNAIFVSGAVRKKLLEAGIPVLNSSIIHTGIDFEPYSNNHKSHHLNGSPLNLLYAGRLSPEKGVNTAIQAMSELVKRRGFNGVKLNIAGAALAGYEENLQLLVKREGLEDHVSFLGQVPNEEMPELLQQNDVLLLPSLWPEPFARIVLEGMISGLVVVATPCGGTVEIVQDHKNGLLFAPGDANDLAQKISLLIRDPELRHRLASTGQQTIKENYSFQAMMDQIEDYLMELAHSYRPRDGFYCGRLLEEPAFKPL